MKIIAIHGGARSVQSQTLKLARALAEGAKEAGADVEIVELCRMKIEYCKACDVCHRVGPCVHKDDFVALREKILHADGIVLASPNYFRTVSAQLKTMLDRMSDAIHCQLLAGKYACSVTTAGGPAVEEVTRYLDDVLISLAPLLSAARRLPYPAAPRRFAEAEARARTLGAELVGAIAARRVYPEQRARHDQTAAYFRKLVEMNRERWPHEYAYWMTRARAGQGTRRGCCRSPSSQT